MNFRAFSISVLERDDSWTRAVCCVASELAGWRVEIRRDCVEENCLERAAKTTYIVVDGAHHTASGSAVSIVVHIACFWRIVLGIDEVVRRAEFARCRLAVRVGPRGNVGEVGGTSVSEDVLAKRFRFGRDEVLGNVRDGFMAKYWTLLANVIDLCNSMVMALPNSSPCQGLRESAECYRRYSE